MRGSGPNTAVVQGIIEGVKVIPADRADVAKRKPGWLRRFRDEVVGRSSEPGDVTAPK